MKYSFEITTIEQRKSYIPPTNEVAERSCFYTWLSLCSRRGGVVLRGMCGPWWGCGPEVLGDLVLKGKRVWSLGVWSFGEAVHQKAITKGHFQPKGQYQKQGVDPLPRY